MKIPACLCLPFLMLPLARAAEPASPLVLKHVTVIDATGTPPPPDVTVVIRDGRIAAVGKRVKVPKGAHVVDAKGKFLIPGLWDMHVHLSWTKASAFPALVANGVTGVRDVGGDLQEIDGWRRQIAEGALVGPSIFRSGLVLDGPKKGASYRLTVTNDAEARQAVRSQQQAGVDFLKIHNAVPREAYFALLDEARKSGLKLAGHIPKKITPEEACVAGQNSIEHLNTLFEGTLAAQIQAGGAAALADYRQQAGAALIACLVKSRVFVTPILERDRSVNELMESHAETDLRARYLSQSAKRMSDRYAPLDQPVPAAMLAARKQIYPELLKLTGAMQQAGVALLAGTDLAGRGSYPGFSLHDELGQFVEAGLTPLQALQTATRNPAEYLGQLAERGTIETGKIADLVLLDADPLQDIRNTQKIRAVVLRGRYLERKELDRLLAQAEAQAAAE